MMWMLKETFQILLRGAILYLCLPVHSATRLRCWFLTRVEQYVSSKVENGGKESDEGVPGWISWLNFRLKLRS